MSTTSIMNLKEKIQAVTDFYSPKIIGEVNDIYIKLVRIIGNKVPWHTHQQEDELFYIVEGSLLVEIEDQEPFTMQKGDLYIIPRGKNHRVSSCEECQLMLIENKTTEHTGDVLNEITKSITHQKK